MKTFSPVHAKDEERAAIAQQIAEYEERCGPIETQPIRSEHKARKYNAHHEFENRDKPDVASIVADYRAGKTLVELADKYGRPRSTIQVWIKEKGAMRTAKASRAMRECLGV